MKKHELAAIFSDENGTVPDLGPIEGYLAALAEEPQLPSVAVAMCAARMEEAGPALRALLARAADGQVLSVDEARLLFRGLHLLGGARDHQAWQPLLRLLRRPSIEIEETLDGAIVENLSRIAAGMFDGDSDGLFAVIADRALDEFLRETLFGAATFLTWEGRIERDRMQDFLERFHDERLVPDLDFAWIGWLEAIALLGLRVLTPRVDSAWRDGRIPEFLLNRPHFEAMLAEAESAPADIERFHRADLGYIVDVLETLESIMFDEPFDPDSENPFDRDDDDDPLALTDEDLFYPDEPDPSEPNARAPFRAEPSSPVINPLRHVGRNDPCPCGSGKKAKKCCLAS